MDRNRQTPPPLYADTPWQADTCPWADTPQADTPTPWTDTPWKTPPLPQTPIPPRRYPSPWVDTLTPVDGQYSGRYASHWNAF